MSSGAPMLSGDQWKDPNQVESWKAQRRLHLEQRWKKKFKKSDGSEFRQSFASLLHGVPLAVAPDPAFKVELAGAAELVQWENESLNHRARRLEGGPKSQVKKPDGRAIFAPPMLLANDRGDWLVTPAGKRAKPERLAKGERMYVNDLMKKANRELACGLLGWVVTCKENGHTFKVPYQCGNRYCTTCGPRNAIRLFAKHFPRLLFVATRLMLCRSEDAWGNVCDSCSKAIEAKQLPHWPPARGIRPRVVVAKIDFTIVNTGKTPGPLLVRELNENIKAFCRALERRFHIKRKDYGLAYCDELGANNSNVHAHGIYVGPWLPQRKGRCELSQLWAEVTGYNGSKPRSLGGEKPAAGASAGGFIISIKYAKGLEEALYHAIKYPAKYILQSTPERLADLEIIFHRVRRFHTLAAFYSPEVPEDPNAADAGSRHCPICDSLLSERGPWEMLYTMDQRGLEDITAVEKRIARERGLTGLAPPP